MCYVCVCAQVVDTLGKSFQIHLFRSSVQMTPAQRCQRSAMTSFAALTPSHSWHVCVTVFVCKHVYTVSLFVRGNILGSTVKCLIQREKLQQGKLFSVIGAAVLLLCCFQ